MSKAEAIKLAFDINSRFPGVDAYPDFNEEFSTHSVAVYLHGKYDSRIQSVADSRKHWTSLAPRRY